MSFVILEFFDKVIYWNFWHGESAYVKNSKKSQKFQTKIWTVFVFLNLYFYYATDVMFPTFYYFSPSYNW